MTITKTVPGPAGRRYIVSDKSGRELGEGDTVTTFRGEEAQLIRVDAAPIIGKSAKVATTLGVHYESVCDLTVTPVPDATLAEIMGSLDAVSRAAARGDREAYRAALQDALSAGVTDDQIFDAYRWGRRNAGAADFNWKGESN